MSPRDGISHTYHEDGQTFLAVNTTHAISEDWLLTHTADLWRKWLATPHPRARDRLARRIDAAFDQIEESPPSTGPRQQGAVHSPLTAPTRNARLSPQHTLTHRTIGRS
ncbi:MAG: hypothetical protein ACTHMS_05730 [Jatrophihabitans sp.]|uniref:hypothetical protein n=1 Tax=Jatrophihabitans sp. TaxID=1932789 RepID=UPI003F7F48CD